MAAADHAATVPAKSAVPTARLLCTGDSCRAPLRHGELLESFARVRDEVRVTLPAAVREAIAL